MSGSRVVVRGGRHEEPYVESCYVTGLHSVGWKANEWAERKLHRWHTQFLTSDEQRGMIGMCREALTRSAELAVALAKQFGATR